MAELQWVIEVRCINTLLAEIKTGEKGEHFCVNVPNSYFDPSEFEKLIEGFVIANRIEEENRKKHRSKMDTRPQEQEKISKSVEIIENREYVKIRILKTGEIVNVDIPDVVLAPSEVCTLIKELKAVKSKMKNLRNQ
jgi:hypothetical protein